MKGRVILIGPAHPLRGGLASFDHRLARQFAREGYSCTIISFSLQYPSFFFPGKTQYATELQAPEGLHIISSINSINPLTWFRVGRRLRREQPDLVVVRYWIPFLAPALGTILRQVRKNGRTRIVAIADNVLPHEKRPGDHALTRFFLSSCDAFVTMSEKVMQDLHRFLPAAPVRLVRHPLYDNFGDPVSTSAARSNLGIEPEGKIILFFGFIRRYKGLDILLEAMGDPRIRQADIRLLIAGEFYESEKIYQEQINRLGIRSLLILHTGFIPDDQVKYYLSAADVVIQPYRHATQSGVTPLAYHFEKPMIVTDVGGLPSMVPDGKAGLVVRPDPKALANGILRFYELGEHYFIPHLRVEKEKYSWANLVHTISALADDLPK